VSVVNASDLIVSKVQSFVLDLGLDSAIRRLDGLIEQERFADVFYLGYRTFQVEGFGEHNLEDLKYVSTIGMVCL